MSKNLVKRLQTPLSQMDFASDDDMMAYVVKEREECARRISWLNMQLIKLRSAK